MHACEDITEGEQIFQFYGSKCNSVFFLNYGFVNLNNDSDKVPMTVFLNKDDPLYALKSELINEK